MKSKHKNASIIKICKRIIKEGGDLLFSNGNYKEILPKKKNLYVDNLLAALRFLIISFILILFNKNYKTILIPIVIIYFIVFLYFISINKYKLKNREDIQNSTKNSPNSCKKSKSNVSTIPYDNYDDNNSLNYSIISKTSDYKNENIDEDIDENIDANIDENVNECIDADVAENDNNYYNNGPNYVKFAEQISYDMPNRKHDGNFYYK